MKRQWMLIALLASAAAAHGADAYRWVDANGVVHYSDAPPPVESKAELVHLPGASTATAAAVPKANQGAAQDDARDPAAKKPKLTEATPVQNSDKRCADARTNLEVLQRSGPVGIDTGDGKPKPLDENARQQQIYSAQSIIATYCK